MLQDQYERTIQQNQQNIQQIELRYLTQIGELEKTINLKDTIIVPDDTTTSNTIKENFNIYQEDITSIQVQKDIQITELIEYSTNVYNKQNEWKKIIINLRNEKYIILKQLYKEHKSRIRNSTDMDYVKQIFIRYLQFDTLNMEIERKALHPVIIRMLALTLEEQESIIDAHKYIHTTTIPNISQIFSSFTRSTTSTLSSLLNRAGIGGATNINTPQDTSTEQIYIFNDTYDDKDDNDTNFINYINDLLSDKVVLQPPAVSLGLEVPPQPFAGSRD